MGDRPVEHDQIAAIVDEVGATIVVVGVPFALDGSVGVAAKAIRSEIRALGRRLTVPVVEQDERLTTVTADRSLDEMGRRGPGRREVVDQVAAAVLLQAWLDALQWPR